MKLKCIFGIEVPCVVAAMTESQVRDYLVKLRKKAEHDLGYCQDDPDGSLEREVDRMYQTVTNLENWLLRRENDNLKQQLEKLQKRKNK